MISIIVARGFEYTLERLLSDPSAPHVTPLFYDETLQKRALAKATYIFTDLDRLSVRELIAAARLYRRLQESGCRVLNDPATVRKRFALLRGLYLAGLNPINIYLADEGWSKVKFPVFIRVADAHDGPLTDLIHDQAELETALEAAVVAGIPRSTIVIVEYAAEPIRPGIYRKSSIHRVGERLITTINWHARDWRVKGDEYVADETLYDEELSTVREDRYASQTLEAFKFANIEYGRIDFGFVEGRLCVYEINTNPQHFSPGRHSVPQRIESSRLRWSRLLEALHAIDTKENSAEIEVEGLSVEAWDRASKLSPALRVPRRLLSEDQERRGDLELALRYAEEAVAANPSSPAWFRLAKLLDKQGRTEQAVAAARKALELSPKEGPHYVLLATILLKAGRYAEARDCAEESIALRAERWEPHLLLSKAQWELGALEDALRSVRRAAELNSEEPSVSKWGGTLTQHLAGKYLKAGRYAEARDCAEESIALRAERWEPHLLLSKAQWELGALEDALRSVRRAAELNSEEPSVSKWGGTLTQHLAGKYLKAGRYAEARDCAEESITLRAERWEPHLLLSKAQWELGALEDALRSVRRAAGLNSEEPSVSKWGGTLTQRLAGKYLKTGRYAEARDCLREAIVGAEPNGISHLLLSEAYLKLGDFRGAWRAAARAADLAPEQAKVHDARPLFYIVMKAIWWLTRFRSRLDHRLRAFKTKAGWVA